MLRSSFLWLTAIVAAIYAPAVPAQVKNFEPVTQEKLINPSPDDWLHFSRTYDSQRFSPLKQITKKNVGQLRMVWTRGMGQGTTGNIPLIYQGVMYVINPGGVIQALDATNGNLVWEYKRELADPKQASNHRTKNLAIFEDMVYYTAPEGYLVAIDARTGKLRWETKVGEAQHTSGPIVVDGKVISARACAGTRESCFIAAHDAKTGKELWKFYNVPGPGEPGNESWGGAAMDKMMASDWSLPGSYDPITKLVYWGISNPMPNTRADRHGGNPMAISLEAPADLYSNSTVALDPNTGKLQWYYQQLPGDDWDSDMGEERVLVRTRVNANSKFVKWINPDIPKGEVHEVAVSIGEPGGIFVIDRKDGKFLWATPFPYDVPEFVLSDINVKTGKTRINDKLIFTGPGQHKIICFWNTKTYWPSAYNPNTNSLYIPWTDICLDMTSKDPEKKTPERRFGTPRPGGDLNKFAGLAKVNLETGEVLMFGEQRVPTNGAVLATGGDLVFHGDLDRRFRAYDAVDGKMLWETILGGPVSVSTVSYAVNGKQYICVMTGDTLATNMYLRGLPDVKPIRGQNAVYVFALPDQK
jgi:PQQ-dependent dehydrogenase (methanol/ethanol family)